MDLIISEAGSRTSKHWKNKTYTWDALKKRLSETVRTGETVAEYKAMSKADQDLRKDVGGFVGGKIKGGRRVTGAIENRCLITLDADFGDENLLPMLEMLGDFKCAVYSTHKHTPSKPRLRVIIPLKRPVTPDEYGAVSRKIAEDIGIEYFDDTTYQPQRLMYWPSTSSDGEFVFKDIDGPVLDPDEVLARYGDWKDITSWPCSSRVSEAIHKKAGAKQADPMQKSGVIGAFCRTYSIEDAIEKFLPDIYVPCESVPGRYSYAAGSTVGGAVIYDGGKFLYSHHSTDPCCGQLLNAFDLVRLHLFGDKDEDVAMGTPVNKRPSYMAMTEFIQQDEAVKIRLVRERADEAKGDFKEGSNWEATLKTDSKGNIKSTIKNVVIIMMNDPQLIGTVARNDFKERPVLIHDTPWHKVQDKLNGDVWTDTDDAQLRLYIEECYGIEKVSKIYDATNIVADEQHFHPVRDYLQGLEWDGIDRLETAFIEYLGAENNEYVRAVSRKMLVGAVARVMEPGCKFDYMTVLVGKQGLGKSSFIAELAGAWFSDTLTCISGKEAYEQIQGFWLIEVAELSAMRKMDIEAIKHFITKRVDSYRAAYGRRVEDHPRQCILIGTTNSTAFLRDDTGNRRFWPVQVTKKFKIGDINKTEIDQLWAEALYLYRKGEPLYLPRELEEFAESKRSFYEMEDPNVAEVQAYLERLLPEEWGKMSLYERRAWLDDEFGEKPGCLQRTEVCTSEIWREHFRGDGQQLLEQRRALGLTNIMQKMPGWVKAEKKIKFPIYGTQWGYVRIGDPRAKKG